MTLAVFELSTSLAMEGFGTQAQAAAKTLDWFVLSEKGSQGENTSWLLVQGGR